MFNNNSDQWETVTLTSIAFISSASAAAGTLTPGIGTVSATMLSVVSAKITPFFAFCLVVCDSDDEGELISAVFNEDMWPSIRMKCGMKY